MQTLTDDDEDIEIKELAKTIKAYRLAPSKFVADNLACPKFNKKQQEVFDAFFKYRKLAVSTHNAFGKSFIAANIALTLPNLYPKGCEGLTLAPTFSQVSDIIWREMRDIFNKSKKINAGVLPLGKILTVRYEIDDKCFVKGKSPKLSAAGASTPQVIQGQHEDVVFIIIDEACGIEDQIFEQIERIASTAGIVYILLIGNPLTPNSYFGRIFTTDEGEGYKKMQYTAFENENMIVNGLISLAAIEDEAVKIRSLCEEERLDYYENKHYTIPEPFGLSPGWVMKCYIRWGNSPLFQAMILGLWVTILENTRVTLRRMQEVSYGKNIKGEWISEESQYTKWNEDKTVYSGIDCGREGKDRSVLTSLEGNRESYCYKFSKTYVQDNTDYRGQKLVEDGPFVARHWYQYVYMQNPDTKHIIGIDCTGGYGDTIYDALMKMPELKDNPLLTIVRLVYSERAVNPAMYHNKATEMFVLLTDDINSTDGVMFYPDNDLKNEITNRKVFLTTKNYEGKTVNCYKLESKEDFKARNNSISPDTGDSKMMANYLRHIRLDYTEELTNMINRPKKTRKSKIKDRY